MSDDDQVLAPVMQAFTTCAPIFQALGDPHRQAIVLLLAQHERLAVKVIAEQTTGERIRIDRGWTVEARHPWTRLRGRAGQQKPRRTCCRQLPCEFIEGEERQAVGGDIDSCTRRQLRLEVVQNTVSTDVLDESHQALPPPVGRRDRH